MKNVKNAESINLPKLRRISKFPMFDNYFPGQRVQIDYAVKGNQNYLSMVCALTDFKTTNQSKTKL